MGRRMDVDRTALIREGIHCTESVELFPKGNVDLGTVDREDRTVDLAHSEAGWDKTPKLQLAIDAVERTEIQG